VISVLVDQCVNLKLLTEFEAIHFHFVRVLQPGAPDTAVMALAQNLDAILLTNDRDFGRLIFRHGLAPPPGLIMLDLDNIKMAAAIAIFRANLLEAARSAIGYMVVISPERLRYRPLPV
jgi:predicted nuclease of predicted toxin-antitoxin system